jgi:hypothetical protein
MGFGPSHMNFTQPSRTSAQANGSDAVWFLDLPFDTTFLAEQLPIGATSRWSEASGSFEATFYPAGDYRFTLMADGYDPLIVTITALECKDGEPTSEPVDDPATLAAA